MPEARLGIEFAAVSDSKRKSRMTINQKGRITRRGFIELSSGAVAAAGILAGVDSAEAAPDPGNKVDPAKADSAPITGKIAFEEHFALPGTIDASYASLPTPESRLQLQYFRSYRHIEAIERLSGRANRKVSQTSEGIRGIAVARS